MIKIYCFIFNSMANQQAQAKLQRAVEDTLDQLEREKLRHLLAESHLCSARCCHRSNVSKAQFEACMSTCFIPPKQIQKVITNELNTLHDRLSRCAQGCQDTINDKAGNNPSTDDVNKLENELDTCTVKCCETSLEFVPKMTERINEALKELSANSTTMHTEI